MKHPKGGARGTNFGKLAVGKESKTVGDSDPVPGLMASHFDHMLAFLLAEYEGTFGA
jgi:hypothetical protein